MDSIRAHDNRIAGLRAYRGCCVDVVTISMSEITKALVKFQRNCPAIVKDKKAEVVSERTGGKYTYEYADLAGVLSAIRPALSDCGLFLTQVFDKDNGSTLLVTRIMHESGELISSTIDLPLNGLPPQKAGSVITYYRRYAAIALLGIAAEDDDGKAAQDAGAVHGRITPAAGSSTLKQQLKDSIAAENGKKNYDTPALPEHVADKRFHTLIGETGKTVDLFKSTPAGMCWKRTAVKEVASPLFRDLDAAATISELEAVPLSAENKLRLEVCKLAVPVWHAEFERRFRDKHEHLSDGDDPGKFLRA